MRRLPNLSPDALTADLARRFWAKVDRDGPVPDCRPDLGPCWIWTGAKRSRFAGGPHEYGTVWAEGRDRTAHSVAWQLAMGPIPEGHELDHLCFVKFCVNPAHLEPVTHAENQRRASAAGRGWGGPEALRTSCPEGHPYDMIDGEGFRRCAECRRRNNRERQRAYRERQRALTVG